MSIIYAEAIADHNRRLRSELVIAKQTIEERDKRIATAIEAFETIKRIYRNQERSTLSAAAAMIAEAETALAAICGDTVEHRETISDIPPNGQEISKLLTEAALMREQLQDALDTIRNLKGYLEVSKEHIRTIDQRIVNQREEINNITTLCKLARSGWNYANNRLAELETAYSKAQSLALTYHGRINYLESDVRALTKIKEDYESIIQTLEGDIQILKLQLSAKRTS